jgi:hypothetical protein
MPNIDQELNNIKNAVYGQQVRMSIHDGLKKMNTVVTNVEASEVTRVTAENTRKSAETTRVASETARVSSENTRKSAENTRVASEVTRVTAETARVSSENTRVASETARNTSENTRKLAETARVTTENNRVNYENDRVASETARNTSENTRKLAETARVTAETARVDSENDRKTAEINRINWDVSRTNAENIRVNNENERKTDETTRINNENARVFAETNRTTTFNTSIQNANTATDRANTAALACEDILEEIADGIDIKSLPVEFDDFTNSEPVPSLWTSLKNMISGAALQTLLKNIKAAMIRLTNKFNDTEYSSSGPSISYDSSNESKAVVSRIKGNTVNYIPNPNVDISPDNVQTFMSASDYYVTSNNGKNLCVFETQADREDIKIYEQGSVIELDGSSWSEKRNYSIAPNNDLILEANVEYVLKMKSIRGSVSGNIIVSLLYITDDYMYVVGAEVTSLINEVSFTLPIPTNTNRIKFDIRSATDTTVSKYAFVLSLSKKDDPCYNSGFHVNQELHSVGDTYYDSIEHDEKTNVTTKITRIASFFPGDSEDGTIVKFDEGDMSLMVIAMLQGITVDTIAACNCLPIMFSTDEDGLFPVNGGFIITVKKIRLDEWSDELSDVEKVALLKNWLQINHVEIRYVKTEPTTSTIEQLMILDSFDELTNINTSSDPKVHMDVDFKSKLWNVKNTSIPDNILLFDTWEEATQDEYPGSGEVLLDADSLGGKTAAEYEAQIAALESEVTGLNTNLTKMTTLESTDVTLTRASYSASQQLHLYKMGKLVIGTLVGDGTVVHASSGTIPEGYRPKNICCACTDVRTANSEVHTIAELAVNTNGTVNLFINNAQVTGTLSAYATFSYFVD